MKQQIQCEATHRQSNRCVYHNSNNRSFILLSILSADKNNLPESEVVSGVLGVKASQRESFPQGLVKLCCIIAHREAKKKKKKNTVKSLTKHSFCLNSVCSSI